LIAGLTQNTRAPFGISNNYNQGQPLPHRYLDQLIEAKIGSGAWQPVYSSTFGGVGLFTDEWVLIQTHP